MAAMTNGSAGAGALATVQGGPVAPPTLLGRAAARIPVGGRIRAGIKVLTRRASESAPAREIYERGVAEGKGFDAIERELARALPDLKHPLTPKNVPYFTVRGEDFPNPGTARQIMDAFGEDRGDGVRRLYRFPVVFPADAWQNVMPHELVTWTASERRYWSEYSADGQTRYCKTHEAVPVDANGRRAIRIFGGRKTILRPDNGGLCDPESCPEYQTKKCNLSGRFIFFIPGIKSISAFELPTNSFYAMQAAIEKFQTIGFMRGGRISGFLDGQHTPFYITKRLVEVSRIDDEGRPAKVAQWLIELEAPIDVTALLRPDDGLEAIESRANEAAALLGAAGEGCDDLVVDVVSMPEGSQECEGARTPPAAVRSARDIPSGEASGSDQAGAGRGDPAASSRPTQAAPGTGTRGRGPAPCDLADIADAAAALGVDPQRFDLYADKRWGKGWKLAAGGRKRALEELKAFAADAKGFQDKVAGELEVWN